MSIYLVDVAAWRPPADHFFPFSRTPWKPGVEKESPPSAISKKYPALGDPACVSHIQQTQKASGSLSAFVAPSIAEPWTTPEGDVVLPDDSYAAALSEMKVTFGGALRLLMEQSGLEPKDIDVVVTNSTVFAPCPSLSSMLVNEFKLRPDVTTLSTSGMGCSFGVVGVGAVRDLMLGRLAEARKKSWRRLFAPFSKNKRPAVVNAIFVTGECTTKGMYLGTDPAMLTVTALMRQGAAAVWLSTSERPKGRREIVRAKYSLCHFAKVHRGADDVAYQSMGLRGDKEHKNKRLGKEGGGKEGGGRDGGGRDGGEGGTAASDAVDTAERTGIYFTRDVPRAASAAIDTVLRKVAPKLLSPKQLLHEALRIQRAKKEKKRKIKREKEAKNSTAASTTATTTTTTAKQKNTGALFSFADCCEHFALHPGIHSMLVAFTRGMRLPIPKAMPSFASLRDYANLSAASTWYVIAYLESVGDDGEFAGIRKGERVLQLGVGSGVKAAACVWKALRDLERVDHAAWRHLKGKRVEEGDLPLAVPDVFAEEAVVREKEVREGDGKGGKGRGNGASATDAAAAAASAALDAATDNLADVTGGGTSNAATAAAPAGSGNDDQKQKVKPRRLPPTVRKSAMETCEAQGLEYDEFRWEKKELKEREEEAVGAVASASAAKLAQ